MYCHFKAPMIQLVHTVKLCHFKLYSVNGSDPPCLLVKRNMNKRDLSIHCHLALPYL